MKNRQFVSLFLSLALVAGNVAGRVNHNWDLPIVMADEDYDDEYYYDPEDYTDYYEDDDDFDYDEFGYIDEDEEFPVDPSIDSDVLEDEVYTDTDEYDSDYEFDEDEYKEDKENWPDGEEDPLLGEESEELKEEDLNAFSSPGYWTNDENVIFDEADYPGWSDEDLEAFKDEYQAYMEDMSRDEYKSLVNVTGSGNNEEYHLYYPEDLSGEADKNKMADELKEIEKRSDEFADSESTYDYNYQDDYMVDENEEDVDGISHGVDEEEDDEVEGADYSAVKVRQTRGTDFGTASKEERDYIDGISHGVEELKGEDVTYAALRARDVRLTVPGFSRAILTNPETDKSGFYRYWVRGESQAYYQRMSNAQKAFYNELMTRCLLFMSGKLKSYNWGEGSYTLMDAASTNALSVKQADNAYKIFYYSNPQFYFLKNNGIRQVIGKTVYYWPKIYPTFKNGAGAATVRNLVEAARRQYHYKGWESYSQEERAKYIHDWIAGHVDYDYFAVLKNKEQLKKYPKYTVGGKGDKPDRDRSFDQSAYSVFVAKPDDYPRFYTGSKTYKKDNIRFYTVCTGYAAAFTWLCNMEGINTVTVISEGNKGSHAWNEICLKSFKAGTKRSAGASNNWYVVDCCWDDRGSQPNFPVKRVYEYFERSARWLNQYEVKRYKGVENPKYHAISTRWTSLLPELVTVGKELMPQPLIYFIVNNRYVLSKKNPGRYLIWSYDGLAKVRNLRYIYDTGKKQYIQNPAGRLVRFEVGTRAVDQGDTKRYKPLYNYYRISEIYANPSYFSNSGEKDYEPVNYVSGLSGGYDGIPNSENINLENWNDPVDYSEPAKTQDNPSSTPAETKSDNQISRSRSLTYNSSGGSDSSDSSDSSPASFSDGGSAVAGKGSARASYVSNGKSSVTYETSMADFKAASVEVPATVKIEGKKYKVTEIGPKAFSGYNNLKTVTIGKNVKKISPNAFWGCKKLTGLNIKSKLLKAKSVKGSLKGSAVKVVYVPKEKVGAYKKIFTKKNTGSKNSITVKAMKD